MTEANLLVTFNPSHEGSAKAEVMAVLDQIGEKAEFVGPELEGVFLLQVSEPKSVVKKLIDLCKNDSTKFEFTFNWVPIETWCSSKMEDMLKEMEKINERMSDEETWKMELNKRQYEGRPLDLIMKLTEKIEKRKVDLENPQKIIRVEIIGDKAGISLLNSDELLSVQKLKK